MGLVYDDDGAKARPAFRGRFDYYSVDPIPQYLKHYANLLYLQFMSENGTRQEKHLAGKEMIICNRKLEYWKRHPDWSTERATEGVSKLKAQWGK